jgi:TolB protein
MAGSKQSVLCLSLISLTTMLLTILFPLAVSIPTGSFVSAQSIAGTIAYILPNDEGGDEIRFIAPDGTDDRRIWQVGKADPQQVEAIETLAWRADGGELAFASDHEGACSVWDTDIYAIRPDGSGYRRITQAPTCAQLADYPTGTVHVPIRNLNFDSAILFPYIQGAPDIQQITLGPGQSGTVTFDNVADFGEGQLQWAVAIGGAGRWFDAGAAADVVPGGEVTTPLLTVSGSASDSFGAYWPAWRSDGDTLAYTFGYGTLYQIEAEPPLLDIGQLLLQEGTVTSLFSNHLKWGPTAATADQLLYAGGGNFGERTGIYLTTAGSSDAGEQLIAFAEYDLVLGLDWLPDASGFVYAVTEEFLSRANVFLYMFETQESTRLTEFTDQFAGILSVSPDGEQIVFDRAVKELEYGLYLADHEVWIMNRDGTGQRRLVEQGHAPAWGLDEGEVTASDSTLSLPSIAPHAIFCLVVNELRQLLELGPGRCR